MHSTKFLKFKLKEEPDVPGHITGIANAYGVLDAYNEIVDKGACKRTLDQQGPERPLLWQHDPCSPIGKASFFEDAEGLKFDGYLCLDTQKGKEAYALLKAGVIKGVSIGYDVIQDDVDEESGVRHLKEIKLWESSIVTFPANEGSWVDSVKSLHSDMPEIRRIIRKRKEGKALNGTEKLKLEALLVLLEDLLEFGDDESDPGKPNSDVGQPDSGLSAPGPTSGPTIDPGVLNMIAELKKYAPQVK